MEENPTNNERETLFEYVKTNLENGKAFIPGEKIGPIISDLKSVVKTCVDVRSMLSTAAKGKTMKEQWDVIFQHPDLEDVDSLKKAIRRVTMAANSEAGCEQSNSKYNRSKNKLSSTMKLPMIKARMRVGSNGPPLHLFNAEPVLTYWINNHHRLAQKSWIQSLEHSVVVNRIRANAEEKYTSTMFF